MKKIALVTCGSNFERHGNTIRAMRRKIAEMKGVSFALENLVPAAPQDGDIYIILPIHYISRSYGYMVFQNEMLPVDNYHYRICQDSIGSSIDNLHRHLIQKSTIAELDLLHMQDQLTGLKNRFAFKRYRDQYVSSPGGYTTVLMDIDGLKTINDHFGHLAGNNAIAITARVIRAIIGPGDLAVRYGGDEFLILSQDTDETLWEARRKEINLQLEKIAGQQQLPYALGVSAGCAVSTKNAPLTIEESLDRADKAMYENKKQKKRGALA